MQKNPKPQNWQPIRYSMCLELCRAISLSHLQIQIKIHESFIAKSATCRRIRACNSPANTPETGLSPAPHQARQQSLTLSSAYPLVKRGGKVTSRSMCTSFIHTTATSHFIPEGKSTYLLLYCPTPERWTKKEKSKSLCLLNKKRVEHKVWRFFSSHMTLED